jgi:hypothetical protein
MQPVSLHARVIYMTELHVVLTAGTHFSVVSKSIFQEGAAPARVLPRPDWEAVRAGDQTRTCADKAKLE